MTHQFLPSVAQSKRFSQLLKKSLSLALPLLFGATAQAQVSSFNVVKVLGQPDFTSSAASVSDTTMNRPWSIAHDLTGNMYVADNNNRVLIFRNVVNKPSGAAADFVLGQSDFYTATPGTSANNMSLPVDLMLDNSGNLYVADYSNNRFLIFKNMEARVNNLSLTNGAAADYVIGQSSLSSSNNGTAANAIWGTQGMAMDAAGNFYAVDYYNHRILAFDGVRAAVDNGTMTNGRSADRVFGRPNMTTGNFFPDPPSDSTLAHPHGLTIDAAGNLYVADHSNNRVLRFDNIASKPSSAHADVVLGQTSFTSNATGNNLSTMNHPSGVLATYDNQLLVSDMLNFRVLRFGTPGGLSNGASAVAAFGGYINGAAQNSVGQLGGMTILPAYGLWVADMTHNRVVMYSAAQALPVSLLSFTAAAKEYGAVLQWELAAGQDLKTIEVERSADGNHFSTLAVLSAGGQTRFSYTDTKARDGRTSYRLALIGTDGQKEYSPVRVLDDQQQSGMPSVWPNPATDRLTVSAGSDMPCTVWISNLAGHTVVAPFAVKGSTELSVSHLPAGTYFVHFSSGACLKLVK